MSNIKVSNGGIKCFESLGIAHWYPAPGRNFFDNITILDVEHEVVFFSLGVKCEWEVLSMIFVIV